ncbi:MAG TPA: ABC transporter permease [Kofleriaceae bacterium]
MRVRVLLRLLTVEASRAVVRNKLRSSLAMLGIAAAVANVIVVVALGHAAVRAAENDLELLGNNLVWIEAGSRTTSGARTGIRDDTLTPGDAQAIRDEVPAIGACSEQVDGGVIVVHGDHNWTTRFRGVAPAYRSIKRWELADGDYFTADDTEHARRVIVIGATVARELFGDEPAVGELIRSRDTAFEVIGVLAPKGASVTGQDQDDTVMLPWTTARRHFVGKDQTWLDDVLCSAVSPDLIRKAGADISDLMRDRHRIPSPDLDDFNIRHPEDALQANLASKKALARLFLVIASLSMIVGGVGIMNVMLASVSQRINEIGIRASVGATPSAIRVQFLAEAFQLTAVGALLGIGLGEVAAWAFQTRLQWQLAMSTEISVACALAAMATGILAGAYPAHRAASLDPIQALRNE